MADEIDFAEMIIRHYRERARIAGEECAIEAIKCAVASIAALAEGRPVRAAALAAHSTKCSSAAVGVKCALMALPTSDPKPRSS